MSLKVYLNDVKTYLPGGQVFSSTDLGKGKVPGIVFPLAESIGQLSVSSIVDHHHNLRVEIAHNEARYVKSSNDSIDYHQGMCIAYVKDKDQFIKVSEVEKLFGKEDSTITANSYVVMNRIQDLTSIIKDIVAVWNSCNYKANTDFVFPENVKKFETKYSSSNIFKDSLFDQLEPIESSLDIDNYSLEDTLEKRINTCNLLRDKKLFPELCLLKDFEKKSLQNKKSYLHKLDKAYFNTIDDGIKTYKDYTNQELIDEYISTIGLIYNDLCYN